MKVESMLPSIVKGTLYAVDKSYLSDLCRLMTLMMSIPPMNGTECDMDVKIKIAFKGGESDGAHPKIILFMDPTLRQYFMLKNDLNPEPLRWYFLL